MTDKHLDSLYSALTEALKNELESHNRLLDVILEETQALKMSRLPDIAAVGARKGDLFRQAEEATQRRMESAAAIGVFLDFTGPVSFKQLASFADVQTRQILTGYREKFADIMRNIKSANETNRLVIFSTLDHIQSGIQFIRNISAPMPHYDRNGHIRSASANGAILSQAG